MLQTTAHDSPEYSANQWSIQRLQLAKYAALDKRLRYVTLRYVTLRYVTLRYVTLRYVTLRYARVTVRWGSVRMS